MKAVGYNCFEGGSASDTEQRYCLFLYLKCEISFPVTFYELNNTPRANDWRHKLRILHSLSRLSARLIWFVFWCVGEIIVMLFGGFLNALSTLLMSDIMLERINGGQFSLLLALVVTIVCTKQELYV